MGDQCVYGDMCASTPRPPAGILAREFNNTDGEDIYEKFNCKLHEDGKCHVTAGEMRCDDLKKYLSEAYTIEDAATDDGACVVQMRESYANADGSKSVFDVNCAWKDHEPMCATSHYTAAAGILHKDDPSTNFDQTICKWSEENGCLVMNDWEGAGVNSSEDCSNFAKKLSGYYTATWQANYKEPV